MYIKDPGRAGARAGICAIRQPRIPGRLFEPASREPTIDLTLGNTGGHTGVLTDKVPESRSREDLRDSSKPEFQVESQTNRATRMALFKKQPPPRTLQ